MFIYLKRNIHTVLGSILLDRIFLEASAGCCCCCCCCCAGRVRTKRENTGTRLLTDDNTDVDKSTLNARFDFQHQSLLNIL